MKTFLMIAVLLAAVLIILGSVCLSLILPSFLALTPWVASFFAGCSLGEALDQIWMPEPLEV